MQQAMEVLVSNVDARGAPPLLPAGEGLPHQGGRAPLVRIQVAELGPDEVKHRGGPRRTQKGEVELRVLPEAVGEHEGGVHAPEKDVQPPRGPRQVVQAEVRRRHGLVAHHDEAAHGPHLRT